MTPTPPNAGEPVEHWIVEGARDVLDRFFWRLSPDAKGKHEVDDLSVKAVIRYCEKVIAHPQPSAGVVTEIRLNPDGSLDEVCAPGFHLEQMSGTHWWMNINGVHVNLHSKGKIKATVIDDRPYLSAAPKPECTITRSADPTTPDYMAVGTVNPKVRERCG